MGFRRPKRNCKTIIGCGKNFARGDEGGRWMKYMKPSIHGM